MTIIYPNDNIKKMIYKKDFKTKDELFRFIDKVMAGIKDEYVNLWGFRAYPKDNGAYYLEEINLAKELI